MITFNTNNISSTNPELPPHEEPDCPARDLADVVPKRKTRKNIGGRPRKTGKKRPTKKRRIEIETVSKKNEKTQT